MRYREICPAVFLARPNRFVAQVERNGRVETVHVKNTGRCKELLLPGCTVYLERSGNPARKTGFDLVAVEKVRPGLPSLLVNMDAQAPNKVFGEWMAAGWERRWACPGRICFGRRKPGGIPALISTGRNRVGWERSKRMFHVKRGRKGFAGASVCGVL